MSRIKHQEKIKKYFYVGKIYINDLQEIKYYLYFIENLAIIISHFENYPLIIQKRVDYFLFKLVYNLISN